MGLTGAFTFHVPEKIGTMLIARRVSRNFDDCVLLDGSVEILGIMIGIKPVTHQGRPHYEVVTLENHSDRFRQRLCLQAAAHFRVMPDEVTFYGGQVLAREVIVIDA